MMCGGFGEWKDITSEVQSILENHKSDVETHLGNEVTKLEGLKF